MISFLRNRPKSSKPKRIVEGNENDSFPAESSSNKSITDAEKIESTSSHVSEVANGKSEEDTEQVSSSYTLQERHATFSDEVDGTDDEEKPVNRKPRPKSAPPRRPQSQAHEQHREKDDSHTSFDSFDSEEERGRSTSSRIRPATAQPSRSMSNTLRSTSISKLRNHSTDSKSPDDDTVPPLKSLLRDKLPPPSKQTAYKRYSTVNPVASKLLAKKWDDAARERHLKKIKTMKACIDNTLSQKTSHLKIPSKRFVAEQESRKKIERENELLLQRMARTFHTPSGYTNFEETYRKMQFESTRKHIASERRRMEEYERIQYENKLLAQRLNRRPAYYRAQEWEKERKAHIRYLLNMTRFPEAYRTVPASTTSNELPSKNAIRDRPKTASSSKTSSRSAKSDSRKAQKNIEETTESLQSLQI